MTVRSLLGVLGAMLLLAVDAVAATAPEVQRIVVEEALNSRVPLAGAGRRACRIELPRQCREPCRCAWRDADHASHGAWRVWRASR